MGNHNDICFPRVFLPITKGILFTTSPTTTTGNCAIFLIQFYGGINYFFDYAIDIATKSNGVQHFCTDLRKVNAVTKSDV